MNIHKIILAISLSVLPMLGYSQSRSLPFLEVSPDARGAGMGGNQYGEGRTHFIYSNPSSFLYGEKRLNVSASTMILPKLEEVGRNMYYAGSAAFKFADRHGVYAGFRYMGGLRFEIEGSKAIEPFDYSIDLAYALRLNDHFSASLNSSFIQSHMKRFAYGYSFGAGVYYRNTVGYSHYVIGANVMNLGPQLDYGKKYSKSMLPSCAGLGGEYDWSIRADHSLRFSLATQYYFSPMSAAMFTGNVGVEYDYAEMLSGRVGFIYGQNDYNRLTLGGGYQYNKMLRLDAAYEIGLGGNEYNFTYLTLGFSF